MNLDRLLKAISVIVSSRYGMEVKARRKHETERSSRKAAG